MISQLQVILKRCDPSSLTNTVHGDMLHIKYLLERHVKQDEQIEYYQEISHIFEGFSWIYEKRCFAVPAMVLIDMVFYYSLLFSQKYDWGKCTTQAAYACVEIIKLANTEILPGVDTFSAKAETMMGMLISLNNDLPYAHTADTLHSGIILPNSKHLELAFDKLTIELKNRNRSGLQRPRHGICADADSKSNPTSIVCDISLVLLRPLPFSVVQHLITLIGKKIGLLDIGSTAFEKPWQQFACIAHTKLHGDSPVEVRAAICGALKAISRIVNIKEKEARNKYQIEFVILVIECSQDDDETVRELAAEVISTILPSGSGTHSAIISRILLMGYISRTATSAAATCWESYLCKQLTQFACLQAAIDAQTGTSKALFNREVLNAFREPVIDILAICQSLMLLQTTSSTNLDSALQSLSTILEQNIEILAKMKPCEQFWQSGEPQFFAAALALVGIAHVVNETESLKLIMQANVNPFIHEAAEMGSSDTGGWHFLCSMLLGTLDMQMSVL